MTGALAAISYVLFDFGQSSKSSDWTPIWVGAARVLIVLSALVMLAAFAVWVRSRQHEAPKVPSDSTGSILHQTGEDAESTFIDSEVDDFSDGPSLTIEGGKLTSDRSRWRKHRKPAE